MKKSLLFAAMSVAACSVMAQPMVLSDQNAPAEQLQVMSQARQNELMTPRTVNLERFSDGKQTMKSSRADADVYPFYYAPGGAFYRGYIVDPDLATSVVISDKNQLRVPSGQPMTWLNSSLATGDYGDVTYQWQYATIDWDQMLWVAKTSSDYNLVTPAIPAGYKCPVSPILTVGERSYDVNCELLNVGGPYVNLTGLGYMPQSFYQFDVWKMTGAPLSATSDSIHMENITNLTIGKDLLQPGLEVKETGFIVGVPASVYGITGVTFLGIINEYVSPRIQFDVYRLEAYRETDGSVSIEKGERLGGGFLNKEDIPVSTKAFAAFTIPVMEEKGALKRKSFLNITDQVIVMLSGWEVKQDADRNFVEGSDIVVPATTIVSNDYFARNSNGYYVDGNNKLQEWGRWGLSETERCGSPIFGFQLYNGNLAIDKATEDTYVYDVPENGGTINVTFMPSTELNDTYVKIEGNGLYDWYDYEAGEYNNSTGEQVLTINVDKLDGTAGRYSLLKVSIPGAEQIITIKQGQLSGIDAVESDADVVASEYFDLMGRKLNAEPESGIFIRKDLKADGTTSATKIAK